MGSEFSFTAGRLLCGHIRDFLASRKFAGMEIEWMESSGWLERTFTVKGRDEDVQLINRAIAKWKADNRL